MIGQGEEALLEIVQPHRSGRIAEEGSGCGLQGGRTHRVQPAASAASPFASCRRRRTISRISTPTSVSADAAGRCTPRSLACPYNCAYCTNDGVYGRKWNALDAEQVVEETTDLVARYGLQLLWIVDDNFLVDRERAVGIAEGIVPPRSEIRLEHSGLHQPGDAPDRGRAEAAAPRRTVAGVARRRLRFAEDAASDEQGFSEAGHHLRSGATN